ncbi:hypothetical protein CC86DRAFT_415965 [Ophiobolus disseminans]|uniref:Uncharacterized protein n=1 Tax=Ophiobolus disseminans TaxID=1469910 RepID=A0A6A7AL02_9PLEO|nr:hypothetical protein CC86DRAFT_415965 [Ophiobolus disseminans]
MFSQKYQIPSRRRQGSSSPPPAWSPASSSSQRSSNSSWRRSLTPSPPSTPSPSNCSSAWRTNAGPPPSIGLPSWEKARVGDIVYLDPISAPLDSVIHGKLAMESPQSPWGHPAIILGKYEKSGVQCVDIRLCTSFDNKTVMQRKPERQWGLFMLVDNDQDRQPHAGTTLGTVVPGSPRFSKRTYINLSANSAYPIEYKYLTRWNPPKGQIQIDQDTVKKVLNLSHRRATSLLKTPSHR